MAEMSKKRCVIVAAGSIDDTSAIKGYADSADFVIAADAGYVYCRDAGIEPDLFVGDYDSSKKPKTQNELIALNPIKDATDTETALTEAEKRGYKEITLLGALGGRVDHTLANLALVSQAKQRGTNLTIIDSHHKIFAVKNESVRIERKTAKYYLSVFSVGGDSVISEEGVYYPLSDYTLSPFSALGVSNEITSDEAVITVKKGTVIIVEADRL